MHARRAAALILLAVAATGCARAMSVGTEPSPTYRLDIVNETAEAMLISYDDGRGTRLLGSVPPGRSDSFILAAQTERTIRVTARNVQGTRTLGPWEVTLSTAQPAAVTLR
jgi:hypothetical protein